MSDNISNFALAIVLTVILVFTGQTFFIAPIDLNISNLKNELNNLENKQKEQKKLLNELPKNASEKPAPITLVSIGEEGALMGKFLSNDLTKGFQINTYDLYNSYCYKPENNNEETLKPQNQANNFDTQNSKDENQADNAEKLAQLDENGMPISAYSESDEEWAGLEVAPVKITFTAKPEGLANVLKKLWNFPLNTIRLADFVIDKGTVKGTMVVVFPLNEK